MEPTPPKPPSAGETAGCPHCGVVRAEYLRLREENARMREEIARLHERLEALERAAHRQAAPFRIAEQRRRGEPKRPGRKAGHVGAYRPRPGRVDEEVEVPLERCPNCGDVLGSVERVEQYIEEIPELVVPRVTRLVTYRGHCRRCDQEVCSRHPMQVSDATGAAGTHLGTRALALATELRHGVGLPVRKVCWVLERCFGLGVTPGGLTQALARVSARLSGAYAAVREAIRHSPVVYADETSWWVNGPGYWLWVFTTPQATLYRIETGRGQEVVFATLGTEFGGRLVSDCLASYDPIDCKKHKCYAHHLRALAEAQRHLPDSAYLREVRLMLVSAMALGEARHTIPEYEDKRRRLEQWAQRLLHPARADPIEERMANRLRKQQRHLFGFLYEDGVEPTNNRAERQLRPAVIARKVSCGNRTLRGKRTSEVLMSLTVTARQQGKPFADLIFPALSKAA